MWCVDSSGLMLRSLLYGAHQENSWSVQMMCIHSSRSKKEESSGRMEHNHFCLVSSQVVLNIRSNNMPHVQGVSQRAMLIKCKMPSHAFKMLNVHF